jgi:hypothetical protein
MMPLQVVDAQLTGWIGVSIFMPKFRIDICKWTTVFL